MQKRFILLLVAAGLVGGCQQTKRKVDPLENSIKSINAVALQYAPQPIFREKPVREEPMLNPEMTPTPLKEKYTIRYYGEADDFLSRMSDRLGFEYQIIGSPSMEKKSIWVKENSKPLFDILYKLGLKLGHDAILDIILYPSRDQFKINLIYPEE